METGVHFPLHPNCHHLITFEKFNLKIHYPPPYEQEVWHYQKASVALSKLLDSKTSPKSYWSILRIFLNNKKIPCIPPLFHNGKFIMDFKEKTELFNDFFTRQCSLVNNNSKLPSILTKKTCQSLSTVEFSTNDILKIIRNLNPNKAHGHDMISIRMLKICNESI